MLIRNKIEVGDIGRVIFLHGELYAKEYGYDYTFEAYVAEALGQFAKRSNPREKIWIVEENGDVKGSIALCEISDQEAQLRWFIVSPQLRGKGIGKTLINCVLDFFSEQSYEKISLWTVKGLEAAKNMYVSHGFALEQEVEHKVWGSYRTEQKYVKKI